MHKTIVVSGFFGGPEHAAKIRYLERLDAELQSKGYRLFLLNFGYLQVDARCAHASCPSFLTTDTDFHGRGLIHIEDLPPELMMAAALDAEVRGASLVSAAVKMTLFYSYMRQVIDEKQPALWIMWHKFNCYHYALTELCKKVDLPYLYIEYGVLPGTVNFDEEGQMAESWVAERHEEFANLSVSDDDLAMAERYLDYARAKKKTRKSQAADFSIRPIVEHARERGRKVIFYAGQNDWASGMLPANWLSQSHVHSPLYEDTLAALRHMTELAEQNDWHILFKPHPQVEERHKHADVPYPGRLDYAIGANIFECMELSDVTSTILSQVSYLALIHGHPCVVLGRNQLRNKGCTYQAGRGQVGKAFQDAVERGFDKHKQGKWLQHVAQLCRYYVFAIDEESAAIIGRDVHEAARFLVKHAHANPADAAGSAGLPVDVSARDSVNLSLRAAAKGLPRPIYERLRSVYRRLFQDNGEG